MGRWRVGFGHGMCACSRVHEIASPNEHVAHVQMHEQCIFRVVAATWEDPELGCRLKSHHDGERGVAIAQAGKSAPGGLWRVGVERLTAHQSGGFLRYGDTRLRI